MLLGLLFLVPFRRQRMLAFLHPGTDPQGAGFHISQSLIAVGTGGLTGRGYMEGFEKLFYLPEASTDFILPISPRNWDSLALLPSCCLWLLECVGCGHRFGAAIRLHAF